VASDAPHNNGMHPTPHHDASHVRCAGARVMPGVMSPLRISVGMRATRRAVEFFGGLKDITPRQRTHSLPLHHSIESMSLWRARRWKECALT